MQAQQQMRNSKNVRKSSQDNLTFAISSKRLQCPEKSVAGHRRIGPLERVGDYITIAHMCWGRWA
jgi:hypothetical protein